MRRETAALYKLLQVGSGGEVTTSILEKVKMSLVLMGSSSVFPTLT